MHFKSMLSRHWVPEYFLNDNAPQYSCQQFKDFAAAYGFTHLTSSPRVAQSNGEAERHVQSVKKRLKKAEGPYLALLAYRVTPLGNGHSPAQLLMGRRLHTLLYSPQSFRTAPLSAKEREMSEKDSVSFNKRHRLRDLNPLTTGQPVWITDMKSQDMVVSSHTAPRSYIGCPIRLCQEKQMPSCPLSSDCSTLTSHTYAQHTTRTR